MIFAQVLLLAILQGMCELLPVSSSAHVIVAQKLMGLDPSSPEMTLVLVMLHTGTMFAVILYFWNAWREAYFQSKEVFWRATKRIVVATVLTGVVGFALKILIEDVALGHIPGAEVELLFRDLGLISAALAAVGLLIVYAGRREAEPRETRTLGLKESSSIGAVQGLCLPFRGFSRSGATISTGLILEVGRRPAEEFSFALAVVLTPPVIVREVLRLLKERATLATDATTIFHLFLPSLVGMAAAFVAGLVALRWLSSWLEKGRWRFFGYYCLFAAAVVFALHRIGY